MQIWKSPAMFVFIQKQYPDHFALLTPRIIELFSGKFVNFLKSRLIFILFYCFWMFVSKPFTYLTRMYLKT